MPVLCYWDTIACIGDITRRCPTLLRDTIMTALRLQSLGIVIVLAFASLAFGDGCYIPERAVRKIPTIPAQRAVLSWKDGQETLVISSALDSESQKLGWIIPLPAVPKTIEKQTPGAINTLDFCIQPKITHDYTEGIVLASYFFFVTNLVLATLLFKEKPLEYLLVELFVFGVLPGLMLPACGAMSDRAAKVQVVKTAAVGSYQISILKSEKIGDLNAWLIENGFAAFPTTAESVVADYISNGWIFAAIKLTRDEAGINAPHPIQMTFAAKKPVYPLKLTALPGGSTAFEIFVIANDRAACENLDLEFCDKFQEDDWTVHGYDNDGERSRDEKRKCFVGKSTNQIIGHPAICSLMWNDCILTKFTGTIAAADMTSDMQFNWESFSPYREHLYTAQGARGLAQFVFICLAGGWFAISMMLYRERIKQPGGLWRYLGRVLLPVVILFAIIAANLFVVLPKLTATDVVRSHWFRTRIHANSLRGDIKKMLENFPYILQGTEKEIGESLIWLRCKMREGSARQNPVTGTDILLEDSPGNFTVEKSAKKVVVRVYDVIGEPMTIEQPIPEGKTKPISNDPKKQWRTRD